MAVTHFTPYAALAGGVLIGLAAVALMASRGRIAGISGIASRLMPPYDDGAFRGRAAFILGLIAAPVVVVIVTGYWPTLSIDAGVPLLIIAGLMVGFGTVWGSGCTSGHGVCGLSRLSPRSMIAVATFMVTAMATVFVVRHVL